MTWIIPGILPQKTDFRCPEEFGYYPHPGDCSLYFVCVFGGPLLESCTGGLVYSEDLQTCDWPRNVPCNKINNIENNQKENINIAIESKKVRKKYGDNTVFFEHLINKQIKWEIKKKLHLDLR